MGYRMAEGLKWDDFDEALSAVRDIGPGGHYLGHPHTQENFQRAFFMPKLFDNNSYEQPGAEGSLMSRHGRCRPQCFFNPTSSQKTTNR